MAAILDPEVATVGNSEFLLSCYNFAFNHDKLTKNEIINVCELPGVVYDEM